MFFVTNVTSPIRIAFRTKRILDVPDSNQEFCIMSLCATKLPLISATVLAYAVIAATVICQADLLALY